MSAPTLAGQAWFQVSWGGFPPTGGEVVSRPGFLVATGLLLTVSLVAAPAGVAEEVEDPTGEVCAAGHDDARCGTVAVSARGDATGSVAASGTGDASVGGCSDAVAVGQCGWGAAVSGTGDSTGFVAVSGVSNATGVVAATGTGAADVPECYHTNSTAPVTSGSASFCSVGVAASGTGDAEGGEVIGAAASGTGNATGGEGVGTAVSGTGDASGWTAASGTGDATGRLPASGTGSCRWNRTDDYDRCVALTTSEDADGHWAGSSLRGDSSGVVAASGTGSATSEFSLDTAVSLAGRGDGRFANIGATSDSESSGLAVSGFGQARGLVAASLAGTSEGSLVAFSAIGDAHCDPLTVRIPAVTSIQDTCLVAASGVGNAVGGQIAVSGTGNASNTYCSDFVVLEPCGAGVAASGTGDAHGAVTAISGTGDAEACGLNIDCQAVSGTGDASGRTAVSGTGDAEGCAAASATGEAAPSCSVAGVEEGASGCEVARSHADTGAACRGVDVEDQLP